MSYKSKLAVAGYILCNDCGAEALASEAQSVLLPKYKADGSFVNTLLWFCWFCCYPVEAPLAIHACLVPLNSTRQQIPEEARPDKIANKTQ